MKMPRVKLLLPVLCALLEGVRSFTALPNRDPETTEGDYDYGSVLGFGGGGGAGLPPPPPCNAETDCANQGACGICLGVLSATECPSSAVRAITPWCSGAVGTGDKCFADAIGTCFAVGTGTHVNNCGASWSSNDDVYVRKPCLSLSQAEITVTATEENVEIVVTGRRSEQMSSWDWVGIYQVSTAEAWTDSPPCTASIAWRYLPMEVNATVNIPHQEARTKELAVLYLTYDYERKAPPAVFTMLGVTTSPPLGNRSDLLGRNSSQTMGVGFDFVAHMDSFEEDTTVEMVTAFTQIDLFKNATQVFDEWDLFFSTLPFTGLVNWVDETFDTAKCLANLAADSLPDDVADTLADQASSLIGAAGSRLGRRTQENIKSKHFVNDMICDPADGTCKTRKWLKSNVDWENIMSPVRNQGYCQTCWAQGAIAAMEADLAISHSSFVDSSNVDGVFTPPTVQTWVKNRQLSVQQAAMCVPIGKFNTVDDAPGGYRSYDPNGPCMGTSTYRKVFTWASTKYAASVGEPQNYIDLETDVPYLPDVVEGLTCTGGDLESVGRGAVIKKDKCIHKGVDSKVYEKLLKAALMEKPLAIPTMTCAYPSPYDFWPEEYNGIIQKSYGDANCALIGQTSCDHVVTLVGYGIDTSITDLPSQFAGLKGMPYWKIRNSWGAGFGQGGYFKLAMEYDASGYIAGLQQYEPCYPHNTELKS